MDKNPKKQTRRASYVWAFCGGYLIYLGYKIFSMFWNGTTSAPLLTIPAAVVFIVVGALLLRREWLAYRYQKEHADDLDTLSDAEDNEFKETDELPDADDNADDNDNDDELSDDEKGGGENV